MQGGAARKARRRRKELIDLVISTSPSLLRLFRAKVLFFIGTHVRVFCSATQGQEEETAGKTTKWRTWKILNGGWTNARAALSIETLPYHRKSVF